MSPPHRFRPTKRKPTVAAPLNTLAEIIEFPTPTEQGIFSVPAYKGFPDSRIRKFTDFSLFLLCLLIAPVFYNFDVDDDDDEPERDVATGFAYAAEKATSSSDL